jgi:hypothetical protein
MDIFLALNAAVCAIMVLGFSYGASREDGGWFSLGLAVVFTALTFFSIYYI